MKAVVYARVASGVPDDQVNRLDEQIAVCYDFAHTEGWEVVDVFIDLGESGKDLDRGGLNDLFAAVARKDVVLVSALDRLSRDFVHFNVIKERIKQAGARLYAVQGGEL